MIYQFLKLNINAARLVNIKRISYHLLYKIKSLIIQRSGRRILVTPFDVVALSQTAGSISWISHFLDSRGGAAWRLLCQRQLSLQSNQLLRVMSTLVSRSHSSTDKQLVLFLHIPNVFVIWRDTDVFNLTKTCFSWGFSSRSNTFPVIGSK